MVTIEVAAAGLVYRNPKPHLRSVHAYHPSLADLGGGELVAAFDLGQGPESMDYRTHLARSTDGGQTWRYEGRLFADPPGRPTSHSVRIARAAGGLVAFGALHSRDDPEEGLVNRETTGFVPLDLILLRSDDGGRSWSGPEIVQPSLVSPAWEVCHHVAELPDSRWLAPTSTWRGWDGDHPAGEQAVVLISDDGGRTWPRYGRTFDGRDSGLIHWEQSIVPLPDGRILAIAWQRDPTTGQNLPNPYSVSRDRGETFSAPRPTGLRGQTCKGLALRDGRVLCVYRRDDQPGLWAVLARLREDDQWEHLGEQLLWQGMPSGMVGAGPTADELADLRFGYPGLVQLASGDVLVIFWCIEELVSNIRWIRLHIAD